MVFPFSLLIFRAYIAFAQVFFKKNTLIFYSC